VTFCCFLFFFPSCLPASLCCWRRDVDPVAPVPAGTAGDAFLLALPLLFLRLAGAASLERRDCVKRRGVERRVAAWGSNEGRTYYCRRKQPTIKRNYFILFFFVVFPSEKKKNLMVLCTLYLNYFILHLSIFPIIIHQCCVKY